MPADEGPTSWELRRRVHEARRAAEQNADAMARLARMLRIRCEECGRRWNDPAERWRAFVLDDDVHGILLYCPGCAAAEFD